ncbi:Transcription initiation factor TFIID subunit 5 [Armadillidium nasatum]|uniref:Transcription initiation factor TFIID subunit 5 n=1 Tax=Armadillidium nasatum TaxID=96803 RepID=A0A5N5SVK3_9CRUS|nr:Transcription initiation factor TFIID subunit 5 [Armadillidium nasatum]
MSDTPTYASLTPLAPAIPTIINGLSGVDMQPSQTVSHHAVMNNSEQVVNQVSMVNNGANGQCPSTAMSLTVLSPAAPATPSSLTSEVKSESAEPPSFERSNLIAVLQFLKKNNLKGTEDLLRRESGFFDEIEDSKSGYGLESETSTIFSTYKNEGDPTEYEETYLNLLNFIERSLDSYKHEVSQVLYPVFVHMYLELVYNGHENMAIAFLERFSPQQEDYYQEDILSLSLVTTRDHMSGYQIMDNFRGSQFNVRITREGHAHLKRYLSEAGGGPVQRIIQNRLCFDIYDGVPRTRSQIVSTAGALEGEASRQVNKTKIFYGLLKEPELQNLIIEEDEGEEEGDKPKKKKHKKDPLQKSKKNDPNAPPNNRIPLPELRDIDKLEKAKAIRDAMKRVTLSKDNLPSICFYTFLNSNASLTSVEFSDDSSLLAFGTSDSFVCIQSITPAKLKALKSVEQLNDIDKDADDVLVRMMDERSAEQTKQLLGHSGPVYSCSFSPDRTLLLTAGKDGTIRLWSLQTWTCLVVYKGHIFPVWDVKFCQLGYYFASGSHDRTARLWATDHHQPLRIFSGHFSDVDVVQFHPNCNYIASGSSDRSIRLWDIQNGNCVRILTGHKGLINVLIFSPCGRYLSSAGSDHRVLVWDLSNGSLVAELISHTNSIYCLSFSRDGNLLVSVVWINV